MVPLARRIKQHERGAHLWRPSLRAFSTLLCVPKDRQALTLLVFLFDSSGLRSPTSLESPPGSPKKDWPTSFSRYDLLSHGNSR